ncbi:MAG: hypothetical protein QM680_11175 [Luteolibacter sp.]
MKVQNASKPDALSAKEPVGKILITNARIVEEREAIDRWRVRRMPIRYSAGARRSESFLREGEIFRISTNQKTQSMKSTILIIVSSLIPLALTSCDEDRAQREEAQRERQFLREMQRQENLQRQADREQRIFENIVQGVDVLTR